MGRRELRLDLEERCVFVLETMERDSLSLSRMSKSGSSLLGDLALRYGGIFLKSLRVARVGSSRDAPLFVSDCALSNYSGRELRLDPRALPDEGTALAAIRGWLARARATASSTSLLKAFCVKKKKKKSHGTLALLILSIVTTSRDSSRWRVVS